LTIFGKLIHAADDESNPSPESPEQREKCVRADLLVRLKPICKDMAEEAFQDLIAAMTREQLRSERITAV
jgi:hypothetical protein